jgi:hypothetical protein
MLNPLTDPRGYLVALGYSLEIPLFASVLSIEVRAKQMAVTSIDEKAPAVTNTLPSSDTASDEAADGGTQALSTYAGQDVQRRLNNRQIQLNG